nr:MAG TPA: hypothetical protein [Caudoviricetes sp.]
MKFVYFTIDNNTKICYHNNKIDHEAEISWCFTTIM